MTPFDEIVISWLRVVVWWVVDGVLVEGMAYFGRLFARLVSMGRLGRSQRGTKLQRNAYALVGLALAVLVWSMLGCTLFQKR